MPMTGDWGGPYKQYFAENGSTIYYPEGGEPDEGKWRVDSENDTYESRWESADWMGYEVPRDDGGYAWKDGAGDTYPFIVMEGKQVE